MIYSAFDSKIKVFGVPNFEKNRTFERVPKSVREKIPSLSFLGRRTPGARIGFRTDAPSFKIKIELEAVNPDIGLSIYACQSAYVYLGPRQKSKLLGIVNPSHYGITYFEKTFYKGEGIDEVTVFLPRNEVIKNVEVEIDNEYTLFEPTPYKYSLPALFYGSSITECAAAENPCASYVSLVSRHLDLDFYNFGFSGSCKGELEMADYVNSIDISLLVYDYDHNAPTPEHLEKTHEKFFKKIREAHPSLPVVMITRPVAEFGEDEKKRRDIVKKTFENAQKSGDSNVYFIDGETFFKDFDDRAVCFVDTVHPTDLGFYKMTEVIEPVIIRALTESKNQN